MVAYLSGLDLLPKLGNESFHPFRRKNLVGQGFEDERIELVHGNRGIPAKVVALADAGIALVVAVTGAIQIPNGAIVDLLERFLALHDQQASMEGSYQEALDLLKDMRKPIAYIATKFSGSSEEVDRLIEQIKNLSFVAAEPINVPPNDDEIPF